MSACRSDAESEEWAVERSEARLDCAEGEGETEMTETGEGEEFRFELMGEAVTREDW
jgi:hypothetical protein